MSASRPVLVPFTLEWAGSGAFGGMENGHSLWAGVRFIIFRQCVSSSLMILLIIQAPTRERIKYKSIAPI